MTKPSTGCSSTAAIPPNKRNKRKFFKRKAATFYKKSVPTKKTVTKC